MPYIPPEHERPFLDPAVTVMAQRLAEHTADMETADCGGRLNYVITTLIIKYIKFRWGKLKYSIGDVVSGVLINVYSEFYERAMRPYEDRKIEENGDVGYEDIL